MKEDAIKEAKGYVDLEKLFDRVNHDRLMGALSKRIEDKRLLMLIRKYETAEE